MGATVAEAPTEDSFGDPIGPFTTTETKWAVKVDVTANGVSGPHILACPDGEEHARRRLAWWQDRRPDAGPVLMRRKVTVNYGPWEEHR